MFLHKGSFTIVPMGLTTLSLLSLLTEKVASFRYNKLKFRMRKLPIHFLPEAVLILKYEFLLQQFREINASIFVLCMYSSVSSQCKNYGNLFSLSKTFVKIQYSKYVRGVHFEKNFIQFCWVMNISNIFS